MKPEAKGARPAFDIFVVEKADKDGKDFFTNIGAAWPNRNGTGFNIKLKALPLDGLLTMLPVREAEKKDGQS